MKNLLPLVFLFSISTHVYSQDSLNRYPKYPLAIGVEHSSIPNIFNYGDLPDNIEASFRFEKKWYAQAGIMFQWIDVDDGFKYASTIYYGGITWKLRMFRNAYFTPQLNFYYENIPENISSLYFWSISAGPTIGAEYFLSQRISLKFDLGSYSFGIEKQDYYYDEYIWTLEFYRGFGLGIRYNFDISRKPQ